MSRHEKMSAPESFVRFQASAKHGESVIVLLEDFFHEMKFLFSKHDEKYSGVDCTTGKSKKTDGNSKKHVMTKSIQPVPQTLVDCAEKSEYIIRDRLTAINTAAQHGMAGNTAIYLNGKQQILGGKRYSLGRTMVMISPLKDDPCYFYLRLDEVIYAAIIMGDENGTKKAFFEHTCDDTNMELDEFCALSEVVCDDAEDGEIYMFTYFNKKQGVVFVQLLDNLKDKKDLEIERLKVELAKAHEQGIQQREEIQLLTNELFKENKDAIKPYASEVSKLNGIIRELQKALETEQAKTPELNALREFAFAAQSEYIPPETTVTLSELIRGKKIIVVGGHVNWRNKMKECYPTITFLDDSIVSFENSIFDRADFILFKPSYMSHKQYYKVIDYLRGKKLRFDYLGRSVNPDLLEAEMISILQEKM